MTSSAEWHTVRRRLPARADSTPAFRLGHLSWLATTGRAGEIARSDHRFDYLHLDDPKPIVRQVRNELGGALGKRLG